MELKSAISRARRGLREEIRLYLVAIVSLSIAFLCLGGSLLAVQNLSKLSDAWSRAGRMTVYLSDDAREEDIAQLRVILEGLAEVDRADYVSSEQARAQFLEQSDVGADLASLPAEVFPSSLEVTLLPGIAQQRADAIAARVKSFRGVSDVETYRGFFVRMHSLLRAGRAVAAGVALLVGFCVLAVIANTIRLAVARRKSEIEVMKLCGATDGFVRGPFLLEGVFQGFVSAFFAVMVLMVGYLVLRQDFDATLAALTGVRVTFLSPFTLVGLLLGGAAVGAVGSAISLRRYLAV